MPGFFGAPSRMDGSPKHNLTSAAHGCVLARSVTMVTLNRGWNVDILPLLLRHCHTHQECVWCCWAWTTFRTALRHRPQVPQCSEKTFKDLRLNVSGIVDTWLLLGPSPFVKREPRCGSRLQVLFCFSSQLKWKWRSDVSCSGFLVSVSKELRLLFNVHISVLIPP